MNIKTIRVKDYIGVEEKEIDLGKVTIIKGPKGTGKTTIVEALEKLFTNKNRRTEVIRHGTGEAILYAECDNGLEVERWIRAGKADYLKIRKDNEGVPSTEKYLRQFINGEIFRPLDWVNMDVKEQTKSILNMLQIPWDMDNIKKWFGTVPDNVEYNQHILMVLAAIEAKYYKDREEVNRQIKELKTQIEVIKKEIPTDYDGEKWKVLKVQEYYSKVAEAQKINQEIERAKALQEGFETKVQALKSDGESQKDRTHLKYRDSRQDIKDIIDLSNNKIEKSQEIINHSANEKIDALAELERQEQEEIRQIQLKYKNLGDEKLKEISDKVTEHRDLINLQKNKIEVKQQELIGLDEKESLECTSIDDMVLQSIETEKVRIGKAAEYIENNKPIDVEPLQDAADEVAHMQSFLREYERMCDIRDNKLSDKERDTASLTAMIEKSRTLPGELLKSAHMPVEGISVDSKGLIRINGTLIDGLSDGEKLELAFNIAQAQCGDLKLICVNGFESLNKSERDKYIEKWLNDSDYQYIVVETDDTESGEMEIKTLEGSK